MTRYTWIFIGLSVVATLLKYITAGMTYVLANGVPSMLDSQRTDNDAGRILRGCGALTTAWAISSYDERLQFISGPVFVISDR